MNLSLRSGVPFVPSQIAHPLGTFALSPYQETTTPEGIESILSPFIPVIFFGHVLNNPL